MDNFFVKSGSLFNYNMAQFSLDKYNMKTKLLKLTSKIDLENGEICCKISYNDCILDKSKEKYLEKEIETSIIKIFERCSF